MVGHLFLLGFMGAGKSTVGQPLAQRLGYRFVDLDDRVVSLAGKSIADVFQDDGEVVFRDLESRALREVCAEDFAVVATGGGIIGREENYDLIRHYGRSVYLRASWDTLQARIGAGTGRPLADGTDGWDRTYRLWQRRCPLYEQADLVIETEDCSVQAVVEQILARMNYVG